MLSTLFLCALLLVTTIGLSAPAGETASLVAALRDLRDQRWDDQQAGERQGADNAVPLDVSLHFHDLLHIASSLSRDPRQRSGQAYEQATLRLTRRGGQWQTHGLHGLSRELWDRHDLLDIRCDKLNWCPIAGLTGQVVFIHRVHNLRWDLGMELRDHQLFHRGYVSAAQWDLSGRWRIAPHALTVTVDCPPPGARRHLHLVLPDGLQGPVVGHQPRSLTGDLVWTGQSFLPGEAVAPQWNLALHDLDPSQLHWDGQRLHGTLLVNWQRDRYVPTGALPAPQSYPIDVTSDSDFIITSASHGGLGHYSCTLEGSIRASSQGHWHSHDPDGQRTGSVVMTMRAPQLLAAQPPAIDPQLPVAQQARQLQRHLLALELMAQTPGMSYADAAAVVWTPDPKPEELQAWLRAAIARATPQPAAPLAGPGASGDEDPDFGPYSGSTALSGPITAPERSDATRWHHPATWQRMGPFPEPVDADIPLPAPVLAGLDAATITTAADGSLSAYAGLSNQDLRVQQDLAYAYTTTINCPADIDVHLALHGQVVAWVWLNDRLIWWSGYRWRATDRAVVPVSLAAGSHRLTVVTSPRRRQLIPPGITREELFFAYQNEIPPGDLHLHLGLGGRPQTIAERQQRQHAETAATAALHSQAGIGWRGDGSGVFSDATPALGWDIDNGTNVAWTAQIPVSHGDPVATQDGLYVVAEPHHLLCLDPATGAQRWAASAPLPAINAPDTPAGWTEIAETILSGQDGTADLRTELRLLTQILAESDDTDDPQHRRRADRIAQLRQELRARTQEHDAVRRFLVQLGIPVHRHGGSVGSATPVVRDGVAYVHFGTGMAMAVTPDGTIRWRRDSGMSWCHRKAPPIFLVERALIIHGWSPEGLMVAALDIDDGRQLWRSGPWPAATAVLPVRLADHQGHHRDVVITGGGQVLASEDGRLVAQAPAWFPTWDDTLPALRGGNVYVATTHRTAALRLFVDAQGAIGLRPLWHFARSWWAQPSPAQTPLVVDDTLLVLRYTGHHHDHQPVPWNSLHGYDLTTGQQTLTVPGALREVEQPATISLAGGRIIITDAGFRMWGKPTQQRLAVLSGDMPPQGLGLGPMPRSHAHPAFLGQHMFLAGTGRVIAVAPQGDDGRALEHHAMADAVFGSLPVRPPPEATPPLTISPPELTVDITMPLDRLYPGRTPISWLVAGPRPQGNQDLLDSIADPHHFVATVGTNIPSEPHALTFVPLPDKALQVRSHPVDRNGKRYSRSGGILIHELMPGRGQQQALAHTILIVDRPMLLRYRCRLPRTVSLLSGHQIADDDVIRLLPGYHPLLVQITLPRLPPGHVPLLLAPSFTPTNDPTSAINQWLAAVDKRLSDVRLLASDRSPQTIRARATMLLELHAQRLREREAAGAQQP